jgi:hypothetical protein
MVNVGDVQVATVDEVVLVVLVRGVGEKFATRK